jgi:pimeloyl-ACP methyl ester carboxylesterase
MSTSRNFSLALSLSLTTSLIAACDDRDDLDVLESDLRAELEDRSGSLPAEVCDQVWTFEHDVDVGDGATLHVIKKVSPAGLLRAPRRAALMLPGTLVTNEQWAIEIDGRHDFDALDRMAREGWIAYAVTYEGYGLSSQPADGKTVDAARTLEQMGEVVRWVRKDAKAAQVDLFGASFGSSLAVALGGTMSPIPRHWIGRVVLQAHVYRSVTPLFEAVFFNPEVQALLEGAPNGYVQTIPEMYGLILFAADAAAAGWGFASFPGVYAVGPTLEGFDLPVFDAQYGRAPALQFWGELDPITPWEDVEDFQSEYGGSAEAVVVPGAGHAPYIAEPAGRDLFWEETVAFLSEDRVSIFLACAPQ